MKLLQENKIHLSRNALLAPLISTDATYIKWFKSFNETDALSNSFLFILSMASMKVYKEQDWRMHWALSLRSKQNVTVTMKRKAPTIIKVVFI